MREEKFSRSLTLKEAIAIGVGGMIGGGIFAVIGPVVGLTANYVLISLLFCTIAAIFTGYNYSLLAKKYPNSGASYTYLTNTFGIFVGGIAGWLLWFGYVSASALYAVTFGLYTFHFIPVDWKILAIILVILFTIVNIKGVKETGFVENIIVAGKVSILIIFIVAGIYYLGLAKVLAFNPAYPPNVYNTTDLIRNLIMGSALIFVAYEGFELIATSAEEIVDPQKNIPRAIFASVIIVSLIYLFTALVSIKTVDIALFAESESPLIISAQKFLGILGEILMWIGSVLSTASALNASLYGASRILYAMARDGLTPSLLNGIHSQRKTPHFTIAATALTAIALIVVGFLEDVAALASLYFMLIFMGVNLSAIHLQKKNEINNNIAISIIPIIIILIAVGYSLMYLMNPLRLVILGVSLAVSLLLVYYYRKIRK
ncbi:MAG: APC family permease [Candidatus Asgardarchaeia archaeon]